MKFEALKSIKSSLLFAVIPLLVVACSPQDRASTDNAAAGNDEASQAMVRFLDTTTSRQPVSLYLDNSPAVSDATHDEATDYREWPAERHDIQLKMSGNDQPVASNSESLDAGEHYTVIGFNSKDGKPGVSVFHDEADAPEAGKARLRIVNVADGSEIDVYPAGGKDELAGGVNFNSESSADVDPGVQAVEIHRAGEKTVALKVADLSLNAGDTQTIVIAADQNQKLRAIRISSVPEGSTARNLH